MVQRDNSALLNKTTQGDAREVLKTIELNSVALSVWSPPYHVGKDYEKGQTYEQWQSLLHDVIALHEPILIPGGFLVVNIADILCFPDSSMPKYMADIVSSKRSPVTREDVLAVYAKHPDWNRYQVAAELGCSEQTVDRRLHGNNIRGGKYETQTRVQLVGDMIANDAKEAGLYLYDRRIWQKDAAWANSNWTTQSYRAVDEFEYLYFFWKPGITIVDRKRLTKKEWIEWGSRAIWQFPSVRRNDNHEAKFPVELPTRVIRLLTKPGDTVLDCFMGSGTTAVAAIEQDRNYIGVELDPNYCKLSNANARAAQEELNTAHAEHAKNLSSSECRCPRGRAS